MKKLLLMAMIIAAGSTAAVYAAEKTYTEQFVQKHTQGVVNKEKEVRAKEQAYKAKSEKAQQERENAAKAKQKKYQHSKTQTKKKYETKKQQFNDLKKF
jgi:hypothetical protein